MKTGQQHYADNKQYYIDKAKRRKAELVAKVNAIKEAAPCADCGNNYPYYVMQFDHIDPSTKVNHVATLVRYGGWKKVFDEIEKCELVCSNCHAVRTHMRKRVTLVP